MMPYPQKTPLKLGISKTKTPIPWRKNHHAFNRGEKSERGFYSLRNPVWLGIIEVAWLQALHHRGRFPPCPPPFFFRNKQLWNTLPSAYNIPPSKKRKSSSRVNSLEGTIVEFPQLVWRFWSIEPNGFCVFNRGAETVLQLPHRTYLEQSWHQLFVHFGKWLGWIYGLDIGGLELNPKLSFNTVFKSSLRTFKNRAQLTTINEFLILGKAGLNDKLFGGLLKHPSRCLALQVESFKRFMLGSQEINHSMPLNTRELKYIGFFWNHCIQTSPFHTGIVLAYPEHDLQNRSRRFWTVKKPNMRDLPQEPPKLRSFSKE